MLIIPVGALWYEQHNEGYYNETIYVQNLCSTEYATPVRQGIESWNDISPRTIVINSLSSSKIYDVSFSEKASLDGNTSHGTYISYSTSLAQCTCHTSSAFFIYINTDKEDTQRSNLVKKSVAAHEMGHALGLGHHDNENYIMNPERDRLTIHAPHSAEQAYAVSTWQQNH